MRVLDTPWVRSAIAGPGGAFSMASANRRPSTPVVCNARASVPANGPRPAEINSRAAHTSSGIERSTLSSRRVGSLISPRSSRCSVLAGSAMMTPITIASSVPSNDMANVSTAPTHTLARNTVDTSGGKNSRMNRTMLSPASIEKKARQSRFRLQKLNPINPSNTAPNQHARHRASNIIGARS